MGVGSFGGVVGVGPSQLVSKLNVFPAWLTPGAFIWTSTWTRPHLVQFGILNDHVNELLVTLGFESLRAGNEATLEVLCWFPFRSLLCSVQLDPSGPEHQNHEVSSI